MSLVETQSRTEDARNPNRRPLVSDGKWMVLAIVLAATSLFADMAIHAGYTPATLTRFEHFVPALCMAVAFGMTLLVFLRLRHRLGSVSSMATRIKASNELDHVNGVLNRRAFLSGFDAKVHEFRERGSVAFAIIDIDHFKQINDAFGHPAGDDVLGFVARCARECFFGSVVGRLGGDEFALYIGREDDIPETYVSDACFRFLSVLKEGLFLGNHRQSISASIGISMMPEHSTDPAQLLSHADIALDQVRRNGRGNWAFFNTEILADLRQERFIERELRAAILLRHLRVHYQPIVSTDGKLNSLEALVRWPHEVGRNISPAEFIPVAEKSQLIHLVGLYVLDCVCQDVPLLPQVPVNINVSARQLMMDSFLADYLAVIAKHAVSPERFIIEITESSLLQGTREFANKILAIREAGIKIALDDFGMGFSEFNQLRTIPFDIIKIDKSFIQNIGSDHVTDVFVRAVVLIANQLRRDVIAEGIETAGEEQRAADVGCRLFQGYHYERPVPLQQLVQRYGNAAVAAAA